jgi:hypothetical protein
MRLNGKSRAYGNRPRQGYKKRTMKRESKHVNILRLCAVLVAFAFPAKVLSAGPLKVFVLAGQSNMQGQGEITDGAQGNLQYMVDTDPATFGHLKDAGGWVVRDDVWVWYERDGSTLIKGGLSVGQGAANDTIGPELQFGHVIGDYYDDQVLLIKTAWGGKSLAVDFRPPSSGWSINPPVAVGDQGYYYQEMLNIVADVLANLSTHFPAYEGQGYEIVGFGWHQGWNDRVNQTYNDEYEYNMANFIRDIRSSEHGFGIPNLPFVIATTGMSGWGETHPRALSLMEAQLAMADANTYPEFEGNVAVVETRDFWRTVAQSPADQNYHWNRNAETYFLIGNAMAEEMAGMIDPNAPSVNAGIDMITWSDEAVQLDPNVVEKEGSDWTDLTYLWSADPNDGVVFDPGNNVEDPNVTISKAPGDAATVTLTLAVNNVGRLEPPVEDTMTIDVYDDACKAAIGKGLASDNPTDFDENCITGFGDLAVLATKWLNDNALTEPVPVSQ